MRSALFNVPGEVRKALSCLWECDRQTAVVLLLAPVFGIWKFTFGSYRYFDQVFAPLLDVPLQSVWSHLYHCAGQFVAGFLLPVLILIALFGRSAHEIGLGKGNAKLAAAFLLMYLPIVFLGCWILSANPSFQHRYPMLQQAAFDWKLFSAYEALLLLYWIGWEYLWRGFLLFGIARTFGAWSIWIQMLPFAALHAQKPMPEAYLSIVGALILGAIVWRSGAFWVAVPIHAVQMLAMDFFCSMRLRWAAEALIGR